MSGKLWPALDVRTTSAPELVIAAADEFGPTAVEERDDGVRLFFADPAARDSARNTLAREFDLAFVDVPDEDWGRRSQERLPPITVGRLRIVPRAYAGPSDLSTIVISPSMGFGTGHHETTRLCLAALQQHQVGGAFVLDVGTGSGILALAAAALGASRAVGIDTDPDALRNAQENLALNPLLAANTRIDFRLMDVMAATLPTADIVVANLTAATLARAATTLMSSLRPGGRLTVSGVLVHELDEVRHAFARLEHAGETREHEWMAVNFRRPSQV
jgi:ribosomal protein L11 methyltransferase